MKKLIHILVIAFIVGLVCVSCRESDLTNNGEGALSLKIGVQRELPTVSAGKTRATLTDEELLQKCKVYIRNAEGLVRKFATLDEMPEQILLVPDNYKAEVTAGDSVAASFTDSYFKGTKEFTISKGTAISESVVCGIRNTVVSLVLSDELQEAFPTYKITVSNRLGTLEYTQDNISQLGYFMLLDDENQLRWNFVGQLNGSETEITKSGVINLVRKATRYDLTFSNSSSEVGGGMISVNVVETALTTDEKVDILARPVIKIIENDQIYELDNAVYRAQFDKETPIVVRMAASVPFTELKVTSADFARLGITHFSSFDLMELTEVQIRELDNLGFSIQFNADMTKVQFAFKENLREIMTNSIDDGNNTYRFDIEVRDRNGKDRAKTLTVIATDALVATEDIATQNDIWSTKATLYGSLVASVTEMNFRYRALGSNDWMYSNQAVLNNKIFTSQITGLEPGITYEYQAMAGTVAAKETKQFTTEAPAQLPNAGFEDWHGSSPLYIYKSGGEMFWDSGNTGSATLNKNVTTYDATIKHSGNYSAKLQSQYVALFGIGAFAAGNVFVGKFLKIDGTDGILRFGRPFTSRPSKLVLYYRYVAGTVDYSTLSEMPKNSKDMGSIYIALGDWPHQTFEGETDIPVLVKTKPADRQLFDSNSSNVIGYGECILRESTEGEGLIKLEIPINYRSNRKPTDIILVGSASRYGDYFTGSTGSTLWLDDLELIYE